MTKPQITCPGYERKRWFSFICKWCFNGFCIKFMNNVDLDKWYTSCPTGGRKPRS